MEKNEKNVGYKTLAIVDPFGRLKVKVISNDLVVNSIKFCNYLYDTSYDMKPSGKSTYFNWDKGFGDITAEVDSSSKRSLNSSELMFCIPTNGQGDPLDICPRNMLLAAIRKLSDYDLELKVGVELEFYLLKQQPSSHNDYSNYEVNDYDGDYDFQQTMKIGNDWPQLQDALLSAGVEVEGYKSECGRGQIEINLRYGEALHHADNVIVAKHVIKDFYAEKGLICTFMAKPNINDAGSGLHTHISLHSRLTSEPAPATTVDRAIDGVISRVKEWMPFYAPNINSYKRFSEGYWAPTEVTKGSDDRTSMIRVIEDTTYRFEFRLPGADANIYLVLVGLIYSICDGLDLTVEEGTKKIDRNLYAASNTFGRSRTVAGYIGEAAQAHYLNLFISEFELANNVVSSCELERYLKHA